MQPSSFDGDDEKEESEFFFLCPLKEINVECLKEKNEWMKKIMDEKKERC